MKKHAYHLVTIAVIVAGVLLLHGGAAFGQAGNASKDPVMGNWVMDVVTSVFDPAVVMTKRTMVFTPTSSGFHCVISTFNANGEVQASDYDAGLDGKEYPTPDLAVATVSFKRTDPNTIERVGKRDGQQVETYIMKLSNGGKTLTITVKGTNPAGMDYSSTQIYNKM